MKNLTSGLWWRAAAIRALRTAGVLLAPYVPTILYTGDFLIVASVVGFGALGSLVTSLAGIAETEGKTVVWYYAVLERSVKTAAQATLALFGTSTIFQNVDWSAAPQLIGTAVLGTLVLAFMDFLPETEGKPLAEAKVTAITNVSVENPAPTEKAVPVVASVDALDENVVQGPDGSVG